MAIHIDLLYPATQEGRLHYSNWGRTIRTNETKRSGMTSHDTTWVISPEPCGWNSKSVKVAIRRGEASDRALAAEGDILVALYQWKY